jgi:anti-sigma factor RsiW
MRCAKAKKRLGALLDGQMNGPAADELTRHVESCASCQRELETLRGVESFLRGALVPPGVPGFAARVASEAASRRAARARRPGVLAWLRLDAPIRAAAAFGCAAGLLLGMAMELSTRGAAAVPLDASDSTIAEAFGAGYLTDAPTGSIAEAYLSALGSPVAGKGGPR